jgi:hypothetical protein
VTASGSPLLNSSTPLETEVVIRCSLKMLINVNMVPVFASIYLDLFHCDLLSCVQILRDNQF